MAATLEIRPLEHKDDRAVFYERHGFIPLQGVREGQLHGDPIPMFLPMGTLNAALRL